MTTDPTTDGGTTGPEECDPNDPSMQTVAGPGDRAGDPCCTTDDSCTGRDVMGQPPQESDVGHQLECVNGVWTVDDTECTEKCETGGTGYLGCFWDSYYGLASPLCGCR